MANIIGNETSISRPILKVVSLISAIATIICAAAGNPDAIYEWVTYIIFGLSGLWSLVMAIVLFMKHRPHPGISLALDLAFTIVMWFFGIFDACALTWGSYRLDRGNNLVVRAQAYTSWQIITGFFHFVPFVIACVDVHMRRTRPVFTKDPEANMENRD